MIKFDTEQLLFELNIQTHYQGFPYLTYSMELLDQNPAHLDSITKTLYPKVARRFKTSPLCMERDIRTIIQLLWDSGRMAALESIVGIRLEDRPTNSEFLALLHRCLMMTAGTNIPIGCENTCRRICPRLRAYVEQIKRKEKQLRQAAEAIGTSNEHP